MFLTKNSVGTKLGLTFCCYKSKFCMVNFSSGFLWYPKLSFSSWKKTRYETHLLRLGEFPCASSDRRIQLCGFIHKSSSENEHGTWKHLYEKGTSSSQTFIFLGSSRKNFSRVFYWRHLNLNNSPENMCFVHLGKSHTFEVLTKLESQSLQNPWRLQPRAVLWGCPMYHLFRGANLLIFQFCRKSNNSSFWMGKLDSGWWLNQPIWKIWVKLEIFPNFRGENKQYLSCHHQGLFFEGEHKCDTYRPIGAGLPLKQKKPQNLCYIPQIPGWFIHMNFYVNGLWFIVP